MAAKKKTQFAILGLLSWKPMSGYDVKKLVDVGLSHFWNENYGQIYPTLDRLVADGLATKKSDHASGKRRRFVYTITRKGKKAFRTWIEAPTDAPIVRNELQLKFFLSSGLPAIDSVRLIKQHQGAQRAALAEYRHSEAVLREALQNDAVSDELDELMTMTGTDSQSRKKQLNTFYLTLRHGIHIIEARLAWCEEAITSLGADLANTET